MSAALPNRMHLCGAVTFGADFGAVHSVTAICFPGNGHSPHVESRFVGGARLSLTPATAADLVRELTTALAKLPFIPDVHDACGEELL